MGEQTAYQIRVYLNDALADVARRDPSAEALRSLTDVLKRHDAALKCQFDAFADYVAEAERHGPDAFPLYRWTKATLDDPVKAAKHRQAFAVRVAGQEVYAKDIAEALEADLLRLVGDGPIARVSKHDTDPANNIPVPAAFRASEPPSQG